MRKTNKFKEETTMTTSTYQENLDLANIACLLEEQIHALHAVLDLHDYQSTSEHVYASISNIITHLEMIRHKADHDLKKISHAKIKDQR